MDYFLFTSLAREISRIDLIGIIVGHIIFGFALTQLLDWSWLKNLMSDKDKEKMLKGYNWKDLLDDQRKAIRQSTAISSTQSVLQHIKTLRAVQNKFVSQLESDHYEIRVTEMVNVIRLMLQLEGAKDVRDTLIKEIAEQLPEAMKKAGISQKKINHIIRNWIEMVKEME